VGLRGYRLILFTRYPVPGKVKTRLIPEMGAAGAADIHRKLTEKTFTACKKVSSRAGIQLEVCFQGGDPVRMRQWLGPGPVFCPQTRGDLGDRMKAAFDRAFQDGCHGVVLLGSDIPALEIRHLEQAFQVLKRYDLVLGPSTDGGYWLMGLSSPAGLFEGISWGQTSVLEETLSLAREKGLRAAFLDRLTDVDTFRDLKACLPRLAKPGPYLSVVIPALNEGVHIEASIESARNRDSEIIVVDGGSRDDTVALAVRAGAHILESPRGRAVQQNTGAAVAAGDVLLFLHADSILPEGYVTQVFDTLLDPCTVLGAFRFRTDLRGLLIRTIERVANMRSRFLGLPYGDQALFVRKKVFELLGPFPDAPLAEDLLLVRQLSKHGRIRTSQATVITSGRRWTETGILRTLFINQIILGGCMLGVSPQGMAPIYRVPLKCRPRPRP
jgi:rSAM/selenodomain-associated transferase 2/rSAM/selenodomain-associated transferase 1